MFRPTVRYETGSCKIVQYSPNFRSTLDYPSIHSSEAKERGAFRKATPSPRIDLFASPSHPFTYVPDYFAVTVAAVLLVMTVGLMKNTSFTLISHAVGLAVPDLTDILPLPRFGAVRRPREFETLLANLYVQIASPEVLQRV